MAPHWVVRVSLKVEEVATEGVHMQRCRGFLAEGLKPVINAGELVRKVPSRYEVAVCHDDLAWFLKGLVDETRYKD